MTSFTVTMMMTNPYYRATTITRHCTECKGDNKMGESAFNFQHLSLTQEEWASLQGDGAGFNDHVYLCTLHPSTEISLNNDLPV